MPNTHLMKSDHESLRITSILRVMWLDTIEAVGHVRSLADR